MYYPEELIEEVRTRNDIVEVISGYVRLQKKGSNYFGLCPFHNEKSPSFSVSPGKQMYYCFGCGAGGNVITFLMEYENQTFPEAVRTLAQRAGIALPEADDSKEARQADSRRAKLLEINKEAAKYFYYQLRTERGSVGMEYLRKRELSDETMNHFGLGYANKYSNDLIQYLKSKGYSEDLIRDAGLCNVDEKHGMYDKFWNRVMFPIQDINHRVIGFGGRVMGDGKPKYLNSPETEIFDKSRNLYGLNFARTSRKGNVILCEGYMDVIAMHQAGFTQAVASLGTAFTSGQASLLRRYANEILLSYDSDGAGVNAALRAIGILKEAGMTGRVINLEPYKDPDEFIKARGADAFRNLIERSEDHNAFRIEQIAAKYDLEDDEARVLFLRDAARMLAGIESTIEREVYAGRAAKMAGVTAEAMNVEVRRELGIQRKRRKVAERREIRSPVGLAQPKDRSLAYTDMKSAKAEENVLRLLFSDQKLIAVAEKDLQPAWFSAPVLRKIYERVLELNRNDQMVDVLSFEGWLEPNEMSLLSAILEPGIPAGEHRGELQEYINTIRMQRVKDGTITQAGEDPLLTFGRIKKQNAGGQTI